MQIGSGLPSFAPQQNATSSESPQSMGRAGAVGGVAQGAESPRAGVPTQDGAVSISAQGAAAAARERAAAATGSATDTASRSLGADGSGVSGASGQSSGGAASQAPGDTAKSGVGDASAAKSSATPAAAKPSSVKSFAYGTLGLERPDKPKSDENKAYTVGRWLAACATVWGLLALIIA